FQKPFAFDCDSATLPRMSKTISKRFAAYPRLDPLGIGQHVSVADLIDQTFLAYNGGRLREAAKLLVEKMLPNDGFIGLSLTGALTPAGLGKSCLIPLMKAGFVDWMVSTGANLYHDLHYGLDMALHQGSPFLDDIELHRDGVIRIYDVLFDYNVLLAQKLPAANRTANPGSHGHSGKRSRLLPAMHRRAARHRRSERRHAGRGRELGQGGPGHASRLRRLLHRFDHRAAAAYSLLSEPRETAQIETALRPAGW